jgi:Type IV secretion-system coupling protein DNA-binding domain
MQLPFSIRRDIQRIKGLRYGRRLKGPVLVNAKDFTKAVSGDGIGIATNDSKLPLRIPRDAENKHFLIVGDTGSGKSSIIRQMLYQVDARGDSAIVYDPACEFVKSVELSFSERIAPAKGLSYGGKITLLSGMQPAEEFSTLVHEIAHEMLHRGDRRTLTTKQVRETEAEAVAFVVCQSVGLQNGTASQDYIQLWHGDANLLRESLEAVQQTAAVILGGIAPEPAALAAAA